MFKHFVWLVAFAAVPASATDTSSLSAYLASFSGESRDCKSIPHDVVLAAKNAGYGCIPKTLSADDAASDLYGWLKGPASANPKYEKMGLEDVMWDGVDALWPCHRGK